MANILVSAPELFRAKPYPRDTIIRIQVNKKEIITIYPHSNICIYNKFNGNRWMILLFCFLGKYSHILWFNKWNWICAFRVGVSSRVRLSLFSLSRKNHIFNSCMCDGGCCCFCIVCSFRMIEIKITTTLMACFAYGLVARSRSVQLSWVQFSCELNRIERYDYVVHWNAICVDLFRFHWKFIQNGARAT